VLSGQPINAYFEQHIFQPLGMKSTCFKQLAPHDMRARQLDVYTANLPAYMQDRKKFLADDYAGPKMGRSNMAQGGFNGSALLPGGGLLSTVSDWCVFVGALLNGGGGLLNPESVALMASPQLPAQCQSGPVMQLINGTAADNALCTMGLGVAVGGAGSAGSFEWGGITSTVTWIDPPAGIAVVCFSHIVPPVLYPLRTELKAIVNSAYLMASGSLRETETGGRPTNSKL
jgi:CubicO group peptidase (beta-lactamase class C family)